MRSVLEGPRDSYLGGGKAGGALGEVGAGR